MSSLLYGGDTAEGGSLEPLLSRLLRQSLDLFSIFIEALVSFLHSCACFLLASSSERASERAWWDTSKGTAVVIWGAGDEAIPHALALRLASLPGLAATLGTPQAGSAPYTAFVILSSAELIPPLIAAWAERKAQLDKARARRTLRWSSSGPPSPSRSPSGEERKEKGREARAAQQEQSGSEGQTQAQGSQRRHRRKRTLSWGGWTAPHVVGMGLDMVKGLRIGEGSRPGMGSVIPIVADTSSPEGMAHARSTISAYCSSHDLVLRALVVVPSILDSPSAPADEHEEPPASPSHRAEQSSGSRERTESETGSYLGRGNEALSPPISPGGQARAQAHAQDLALLNSKLRRDVSDTLALVHALVPTLRRDRGRVVGLVPAGFGAEIGLSRWAGEESGDAHHLPKSASPTRMGKGVMGREVVRDALRTMWAELAVQLAPDGVSVSQVVTAPLLDRTAKSPVPEARSAPHRTLSHRLLQLLSSWDRALFSPDESVLFRSVRAVLQRSYPRHTYYVGIQSRVLDALAVVPGAYWVKRRVARYVTGLDGGA